MSRTYYTSIIHVTLFKHIMKRQSNIYCYKLNKFNKFYYRFWDYMSMFHYTIRIFTNSYNIINIIKPPEKATRGMFRYIRRFDIPKWNPKLHHGLSIIYNFPLIITVTVRVTKRQLNTNIQNESYQEYLRVIFKIFVKITMHMLLMILKK